LHIVSGHDYDVYLLAGFEPPRHAAAAGVTGGIGRCDTGFFGKGFRNGFSTALEVTAPIEPQFRGAGGIGGKQRQNRSDSDGEQ
jgi:hypothetical protein